MRNSRIGIYAGTFDPVHTGHIAFAMQAIESAKLDKVYFLPERRPLKKDHTEHFAHRVAMLKQAIKPHPKFAVMELVDISFSVERTLPKLKTLLAGDQLVFLMGSDTLLSLKYWPKFERLLKTSELCVGIRNNSSQQEIINEIESLPVKPKEFVLIDSYAPDISSSSIRDSLRLRHKVSGTLRSVERYSDRHWLYVSLAIDKT